MLPITYALTPVSALIILAGIYYGAQYGGSHPIDVLGKGRRGAPTVREQTLLYGETRRRHLGLPVAHIKV